MRILAIDPGANPGLTAGCVDGGPMLEWTEWNVTREAAGHFDELVMEAQWTGAVMYRNGKKVRISRKSQQTLSLTAGRLLERYDADRKYMIPVADWRRILWSGQLVTHREYDHPPPKWPRLTPTKRALITRLWYQYGMWVDQRFPLKNQPDILESIGIFHAWARLTAVQKEKYRVR
jgi:hypothetical protein